MKLKSVHVSSRTTISNWSIYASNLAQKGRSWKESQSMHCGVLYTWRGWIAGQGRVRPEMWFSRFHLGCFEPPILTLAARRCHCTDGGRCSAGEVDIGDVLLRHHWMQYGRHSWFFIKSVNLKLKTNMKTYLKCFKLTSSTKKSISSCTIHRAKFKPYFIWGWDIGNVKQHTLVERWVDIGNENNYSVNFNSNLTQIPYWNYLRS